MGEQPIISYLWLNLVGSVMVMAIAIILQTFYKLTGGKSTS